MSECIVPLSVHSPHGLSSSPLLRPATPLGRPMPHSTPPSPSRSRAPTSPSRSNGDNEIPSPSYCFPTKTRVTTPRRGPREGPASKPMDTSPRHQHEIQPPSRRLSSHQMLLLTPFGSAIPDTVIGESSIGAGMTRGMTRGGFPASVMGRDMVTPRQPNSRLRSLPTAQSTSSSSVPMATIPSASDSEVSESESRDVVDLSPGASMYATFIGDHLSTVPMTRSTSSPVMSMKSLEAMRMKDGELGIVRGGMWAWVSHDVPEVIDPSSVAGPSSLSPRANAPSPLSLNSAQPLFRDPFAPATPLTASNMSRETPTTGGFNPPEGCATDAGYHYSLNEQEGRRMSEVPIPGVSTTAAKALMALRRPSVPLNVLLQTSRRSSLLSLPPTTLETPQESSDVEDFASTAKPSPAQPHRKLTRYRSLPDRRLNLAFTMDDPDAESSKRGSVDVPRQRIMDDSRRTSEEISPRNQPRRKSPSTGAWAAVDVVDSITSPSSPSITRRSSLSPTSPATAIPPDPEPKPQYSLDNLVPPQPHRRRWESVDSAFPTPMHGPTGLQVSIGPLSETDWSASFPRRGSLMVLTKTPLAPWASVERSGINVELGQAARTERRGSWVDEWDLKGR